jgi:hypothetical protein
LAFSLLSGYGLWVIARVLSRFAPEQRRIAVVSALVLVAGIVAAGSFGSYAARYERDYPRLSAGYWGWQEGAQEIIGRFVTLQDQYDELYMDGQFNAPSISLRFYAEGDCAKCRIGDSERYKEDRRQLFALRPENLKTSTYNYVFKGDVLYPGGSVAFVFVEIAGRR